jgi:glycosyltransferase involved in cell wall biosynthesis
MSDHTVSVFTPSHDARYLDECYASLVAQTFTGWEWIVVLNRGARWPWPADERVKIRIVDELRGVGAVKAFACSEALGSILVELDHDDVLATTALADIAQAFDDDPDLACAYSDSAQITADGLADLSRWDEANGWEYWMQRVDGLDVLAVRALEPTPHNMGYVWFAPNHVRAFSRWAYEKAGGYNADLTELDDQDLLSRLYQVGEFKRLPAVLYLQRVHGSNTQADPEVNRRIQQGTVALYDATIERLALAWAKRRDLLALDLGGAHNPAPDFLSVDVVPGVDLRGDVFDVLADLRDSSVGVIRAVDFLEHVADKTRLANEIWRVLAPDGMLLSCTPSTDGRGAWQDPTHVAGYNENSFWYLTNIEYARYVPDSKARFQESRLVTYFPTEWHREHNIPYVQANLICLKAGGHRNGGYLKW